MRLVRAIQRTTAGRLVAALFLIPASGATPWILGFAIGVPLFLLVLVGPLAFLGGLRQVFLSNTWTLTFRELQALENLAQLPGEPLLTDQPPEPKAGSLV